MQSKVIKSAEPCKTNCTVVRPRDIRVPLGKKKNVVPVSMRPSPIGVMSEKQSEATPMTLPVFTSIRSTSKQVAFNGGKSNSSNRPSPSYASPVPTRRTAMLFPTPSGNSLGQKR